MSPLNANAPLNIRCMLVTLDTSQSAMSPLNVDEAGTSRESNMLFMSVTAEISQDAIDPCGPMEQYVGDSRRQCAMAALSSALDSGAQSVVEHCNSGRTVEVTLHVRVGIISRFTVKVRHTVTVRIRNMTRVRGLYALGQKQG